MYKTYTLKVEVNRLTINETLNLFKKRQKNKDILVLVMVEFLRKASGKSAVVGYLMNIPRTKEHSRKHNITTVDQWKWLQIEVETATELVNSLESSEDQRYAISVQARDMTLW